MAVTITCMSMTRNADDTWTMLLSDGTGLELGTIAAIRQAVADIQEDPRTVALALAADWLGKEPLGDRVNTLVVGQTCTLDLFAASSSKVWIR